LRKGTAVCLLTAALFLGGGGLAQAGTPRYRVVVTAATKQDPDWGAVVEALATRYGAPVDVAKGGFDELLPRWRGDRPRYVGFVLRPTEATRQTIASLHRLMRRLDDDPFPDALWGIVTGFDAANALEMVRTAAPLTIRKVAAGTDVALDCCEEGIWYCELKSGRRVRKEKGGTPVESSGPADTTEALARALTEYQADLFVTSGHATERDWQIGFAYRNGSFRSQAGRLFGIDTTGRKIPIESPNPKVYMPVGNCLMGHIDGPDAMALAFLKSAGVRQMLGYTLPTWYGYMGWGCLDYFVEQPGRFSFAEAFFANQIALLQRLETYFPDLAGAAVDDQGRSPGSVRVGEAARAAGLTANDGRGLLFDRDTVAFYGDPAWEARLAAGPNAWDQRLTVVGSQYTFEIQPRRGAESFEPVNRNGSQRGYRPIIEFLPHRVTDVVIKAGTELRPVVADDFILVPCPRGTEATATETRRVVFEARRVQ
jgi:zinc protease